MPNQFVLHISKWYPNAEDDLEGVFIQRHIESIHPHFNSIVFYAKSTSKIIPKIYVTAKEQVGNDHTFFGYYRKNITGISVLDKIIKLVLYFYIMNQFFNLVKKKFDKPVIIHAHVLLRSAFIAYWFSLQLKIPYLITEHSTYYTSTQIPRTNTLKNRLRRFIVSKAKAIITVSSDLERGMKKFNLLNKNYFRIFNCVDTSIYQFQSKPNEATTNMLHVSEFKDEHKNILGLLEVVKKLKLNDYRFLFHLVGYGQDLDKILQYIKDNHLNDCVIYHDKCIDKQLSELYSLADVFILFSNKENMPCVIAESLCCGTPVISTNVGGISEVISDQNGILVEKANKEQLYEAIISVMLKKNNFDSQKIAEKAIQLFSSESIGTCLSQLYRKCLKDT